MTKLYVGIDVAKDKFDVSYTVDGLSVGHTCPTINCVLISIYELS